MTELGNRLRKERLRLHLSQEVLAATLGVSALSISRWERGVTVPQAYFRLQLCRLFNIHPEELFQELDKPPVSLPPFWNVPSRRNPYFTGREEVLQQVYTLLHTPSPGALTLPVALTGLAGSGKTLVVVEYAYRYAQDYGAVFWIDAGTFGAFISGLVTLARLLQLPAYQDQDDLHIIQAVKEWLRSHQRWLLILDGIEDLVALIRIGLPLGVGQVLLTTHSQFTGTLAHSVQLDMLPESEGVLFLLRRAKKLNISQQLEEASETVVQMGKHICRTLGNLPLALDQAGAYIEETGCDLSSYLQRYEEHRFQMLNRRGSLGGDHPDSVATTLSLVYEQVKRLSSLAAAALCLCAFLYEKDIPEALIQVALPFLGRDELLADEVAELDEIFVTLRHLSLIYRHVTDQTFCVHGLMQVVLVENMEQAEKKQWIQRTIYVLNAALPEDALLSRPAYDSLILHIQACQVFIAQAAITIPEAEHLLEKAGSYLAERGRSDEAKQMLTRALIIQQDLYGPASPVSANTTRKLVTLSSRLNQDEQVG